MERIGYVRVSTAEQNTARQEDSMAALGVTTVFTDKLSGKSAERPGLKEMLAYVRRGDTVVVSEISRLARSTRDLLNILDTLKAKQVEFVSLKENIDTTTAQGRFMLTVFAALAELERESILSRQKEGIAAAKSRGVHLGRPRAEMPKNWADVYREWKAGEISPSEAARQLKMKRPTFYLMVKRFEQENCAVV